MLWKFSHEALLTNEARCRRNLSTSDLCLGCNLTIHLFRDCEQIKDSWYRLMGSNNNRFFSHQVWHYELEYDFWCLDGENLVEEE